MARVSIEIHSGAARLVVAVQAQSIHQALSIVAARHAGSVARVKVSIESEGFFVNDVAA